MRKIILILFLCFMVSITVSCENETGSIGSFYTLQEAYDNGLLTVEDLESIANYLNNGTVPIDNLSSTIEANIKETRADNLRKEVDPDGNFKFPNALAKDVSIKKFYGEYNNSFVVMIEDSFTNHTLAEWSETV